VHIDNEHDRQNARSQLQANDVLLSITGVYFGESAVVTPDCLPANISQHSVRIRLADHGLLDPYFLATFFNSRNGHQETLRQSTGFTRPALDYGAIQDIVVPTPQPTLQRAIGHKLRAAEKLRAAAAKARAEINGWLASCLPAWDEPREELSVSPRFNTVLTPERLDPWYNHPQFQRLQRSLESTADLVPLSSVGQTVDERWNGTSGEIEYIEIGEFDLAQGTAHGKVVAAKEAPSRAQILARPGDLAVSLVRPNRKNVVYIRGSGERPIVVTSGCDVLRFSDADTASLYSIVLRHSTVTYQLMRWNTGTSYPAIEQLPMDRVLVPSIPEAKRGELLQAARLAVRGTERAKELTASAIADVEKLIDGRLDEAACTRVGQELAREFGLEMP
jgi:hypothetical protein